LLVGAALALLCVGALAGSAQAEPAFGDSDWVAPTNRPAVGSPADPGPRVAPKDHEPTGVSILRLPFRLLFLPLRLVAIGAEKAVGLSVFDLNPGPSIKPQPRWKLDPVVTTEPGAGIILTRRLDPHGNAKMYATGTYAWDEGRKGKFVYRTSQDDAPRGLHLEGTYTYKANKTFYGIGNASTLANKSIWLGEETRAAGLLHFGKPVRKELRLVGTYSKISARSGYNGPAGVPSAEDQFTPAEVPFLVRGSRVYSFGVAADGGLLDQVREPRRGVAARLSAEQFKAADTSDLDYRRYHTEARVFVPVFARRRVFAMRILHDWVDPAAGSPAVPYYRLPETNDDLRFPGYKVHRFTDNHLVLAQAEYRWEISGKLMAALEASAGEVASTASRLRYDQRHEAYGLGLRYSYRDRMGARVDAAKGSEGLNFALTLEGQF
jgi:hypothetical protein